MPRVVCERLERQKPISRSLAHNAPHVMEQRLEQGAHGRAKDVFARKRGSNIRLARQSLKARDRGGVLEPKEKRNVFLYKTGLPPKHPELYI